MEENCCPLTQTERLDAMGLNTTKQIKIKCLEINYPTFSIAEQTTWGSCGIYLGCLDSYVESFRNGISCICAELDKMILKVPSNPEIQLSYFIPHLTKVLLIKDIEIILKYLEHFYPNTLLIHKLVTNVKHLIAHWYGVLMLKYRLASCTIFINGWC